MGFSAGTAIQQPSINFTASHYSKRPTRNTNQQVDLRQIQSDALERGQAFVPAADRKNMRTPTQATNLKRSVIYAVAGFCMGALSGVGITMLLWNGLKDRFSDSVGMAGTFEAGGDVNVDGTAYLDDFGATVGPFDFNVGDMVSGGAGVEYIGNFSSDGLSVGGDASIDIGGVAPVKVVVSVAFVFGIVVGAFTWLIERQMAAAADRRAMMEQQNQILAQQVEMNKNINEVVPVNGVKV